MTNHFYCLEHIRVKQDHNSKNNGNKGWATHIELKIYKLINLLVDRQQCIFISYRSIFVHHFINN